MVSNPWESINKPVEDKTSTSTDNDIPQTFHDSFVASSTVWSTENSTQPDVDVYVPLNDSGHYLAGLERKLGKLNGSSGPPDSRSLLAGLAASRQVHHSSLLSSTRLRGNGHLTDMRGGSAAALPQSFNGGGAELTTEDDAEEFPRAQRVFLSDEHRHLSCLVQRIAPEKLALSAEELVLLLAADSLAANTAAMTDITSANIVTDNTKADSADRSTGIDLSGGDIAAPENPETDHDFNAEVDFEKHFPTIGD